MLAPTWVNLEPMATPFTEERLDLSFTLSRLPTDPEAQYRAQAKRVSANDARLDQHLEEV